MNFDFLEQYNFSAHAKIAAVIGDPISQSLSPHLHNYLLKKYQIDGIYIPLKLSATQFPDFIRSMPNLGFSGCNITIPHKESALKFCNFISKAAKQIGAVNTITIDGGGRVFGDNSDHFGFIQNIKSKHYQFDFSGKAALVLGAGGASRAIVFGLLQEGIGEVVICNRNLERAKNLAKDFVNLCDSGKKISFVGWGDKSQNLAKFDLLINATSLGMIGGEGLEVDLGNLKKSALVCDIVYKPLMTNVLKSAQKQGNPICTGIGMLIYQGIIGFEKWFGIKPEIDQNLIDEMINLSTN